MEQEWKDLLYEFSGRKPNNVIINMIVALLWYIVLKLVEKEILNKSDAIKIKENLKIVALQAYKEN